MLLTGHSSDEVYYIKQIVVGYSDRALALADDFIEDSSGAGHAWARVQAQ
jgi:hypothetical protein